MLALEAASNLYLGELEAGHASQHQNYRFGIVLIKFIGSHAEYDEIDAATVGGGERI